MEILCDHEYGHLILAYKLVQNLGFLEKKFKKMGE